MQDFVDSDQKSTQEILALALGHVSNHYRKGVRRRIQRSLWRSLRKRAADSNERREEAGSYTCGTMMLEAAKSRLYRRHARLLLFLLSREGVYVVNSNGQVFGFREVGNQFGGILKTLDNRHYKELREIGVRSFDELNLDDRLIREHFSRRAESFIATAADEESLYFFFIGATATTYQDQIHLVVDGGETGR